MAKKTETNAAITPPPCFAKKSQATERLNELFVTSGQAQTIANGPPPAPRGAFAKQHGAAYGTLKTLPGIPGWMKIGVFAHKELKAWMRFSGDTPATALGIAIKLWGVDGPNALGESDGIADFIMQNYPVFFSPNAEEAVAINYAAVNGSLAAYFDAHPRAKQVFDGMANTITGSLLTQRYWAVLPFDFGPDHYARYSLVPAPLPTDAPTVNIGTNNPDYLGADLARRLAAAPYRFLFMVQAVPRKDHPPLEQADEEWSTEKYPYVPVATLEVSRQDVTAQGQSAYGDLLAFNIWRTPVAQTPRGSIAEARKVVYANSARLRHQANGQPQDQPKCPRTAAASHDEDDCIVRAVVYPSIGIARIGNAPDGYIIGPEVVNPPPKTANRGRSPYRDEQGRLLPQVARFRLYGVNINGTIVRELSATGSKAKIAWSVHVANRKAAWYQFQIALDLPPDAVATADPSALRNANVTERDSLVLDAGLQTVRYGSGPQRKEFLAGRFMNQGERVNLGAMWCEDDGRLLVRGGYGVSASGNGSPIGTFANNDGWHDDTSDGPVTATVELDGVSLPVTGAWVVVAPPNYGPQLKSVRTMWDLMRDLAIRNSTLPAPTMPSFTNDIYPIFERLSRLQWANAGFAAGFGWNSGNDFTSQAWIDRLRDGSPGNKERRRVLMNSFRNSAKDSTSPAPWPWIFGDAMNLPMPNSTYIYTQLTATQFKILSQWVNGMFVDDWGKVPEYADIDEVPLREQGAVLTRAALDHCLADAFHPGCEMTWPVRSQTMYSAPFTFAQAPEGSVEPSPGPLLTPSSMMISTDTVGPMLAQIPGGISRWMAVPWQADTASCRSGYIPSYDPYLPTFWPARVPNQVLTKENYAIVVDADKDMPTRLAAFAQRADWDAPLGDTDTVVAVGQIKQIDRMIKHFDHMGVLETLPGPTDAAGKKAFPATMQVEDRHTLIGSVDNPGPEINALGRRRRQKF